MTSKKLECIEDTAYTDMATKQATAIRAEAIAWVALQVALFVAQKTIGSYISGRQENLAKRRYQMALEAMDQAKISWPYEQAFVSATMAEAKPVNDYSYAQIMLNETDRVQSLALLASDKYLGRLGLQSGQCDDSRIARGMATIRTDLVSHSMRSAEARRIALSDRRYSRQVAAVALGKGKLQVSRALGSLADTGAAVASSIFRTINSGVSLWGYATNRWAHGGNYVTGQQGAPTIVPPGYVAMQRTDPYGNVANYLARESEKEPKSKVDAASFFTTPFNPDAEDL